VKRETEIEKGKKAQMFISLPATIPPIRHTEWRMAGCETVQRLTILITPHHPLYPFITPACRSGFQPR